MSEAEQAAVDTLGNGATLEEAFALLPALSPEQLASLDERGDPKTWGMDELLQKLKAEIAL
jgi:hypothetical protein